MLLAALPSSPRLQMLAPSRMHPGHGSELDAQSVVSSIHDTSTILSESLNRYGAPAEEVGR